MSPPLISVIIPCRNESTHIHSTLDAILRQTYGLANIEIIVVDGLSTDGTLRILDEYKAKTSQLRILQNERLITASARNIGIQASRGDLLALIDGHCEISEDYLATCSRILEESPESVVCVAGGTRAVGRSFVGDAIALALSSPFGVGNALFRYAETETDVDTAAFGVYRKSIFEKIGYYDESMLYSEDDELSLRITKSGYRIRLSPKISAKYWVRETYPDLWQQYNHYGQGKVRVTRKHKIIPSLRMLVPPVFVLALFSGLIGGIFFPFLLWLWLVLVTVYLVSGFVLAFYPSEKHFLKSISVLAAFLCMHASYGFGVLRGLVGWRMPICE